MVQQKEIILPEYRRGYHLITGIVEQNLPSVPGNGMVQVFLKHTSAALIINENADPSVRTDFESIFNRLIPENQSYYTHLLEGADDMPAHIKASLLGQSVMIPITDGKLNLGIWQGIYLCEFRNYGGHRKIVITVFY